MKTKSLIILIIWLTISLFLVFSNYPARAQEMKKERNSQSLSLTLEDAVLMALKRNRDLKIKILDPKMKKTAIEERKAIFDFDLSIHLDRKEAETNMTKSELKNQSDTLDLFQDMLNQADRVDEYPQIAEFINKNLPEDTERKIKTNEGIINLSKFFSTGTKLELELKSQYLDKETNRLYSDGNSPPTNSTSKNTLTSYTTSGSLTLTQSLLKGRGRKVNLSLVKQSEVDRQISIYELRQYVMGLVEGVQKTYWDLVLAKETLNIRQKSLELANRQLIETEERIRIGKQAESEIVTAQAEVASEKEKLIDVVSDMAQKKLDFILFLNPETDILWDQNIQLTTPPEPIEMEIGNIHQHIATSLKLRPDINQAYLNLQKGDLEVVRTKNGTLPRLDFFLTLKSMANGSEFPSSLNEFDNTDYKAGIVLSRPLGNREAKSQIHRANLQRLKYQESMEYLKQKIQVEVRKAIIEIERYREKIIASQANRKKQAEKLKVEQEKFRLGRSTNLMVFQAQRDLIEAEVNEVTAIINQIKTFIDLHMVKGTLLEQWSLDIIPPLSDSL